MEEILRNIEIAEKLSRANENVKIVAVVSGNESDRASWQKRLAKTAPFLFNRDGSTLVISLQEKIGTKTREGNFLGTLLAYRYIKEILHKKNISYKDSVILLGMIFGRGERMSPITQAEGDRKSNIAVTPAVIPLSVNTKISFCAIEEALLYFAPIAKVLENKGFRGILNKWGDETEIPSLKYPILHAGPVTGSACGIVKFVSRVRLMDILEVEARDKDWVIFDESGLMLAQVARNRQGAAALRKDIKSKMVELGIDLDYVGISLGPVATSYDVLDIASEVFSVEIEKDGVFFDYDPYFLMAIASSKEEVHRALIKMVPDFSEKISNIKEVFREKHKKELKIEVFDLGERVYWADIGLHSSMREKYLALNDTGAGGVLARKLAKIPEERDSKKNIIINSKISSEVMVKNSIVVNSNVSGTGKIEKSVILDSEFKDVEASGAFAVKSTRFGKTKLKEKSGMYNSLGKDDIVLEQKTRHVSVLTKDGKIDMRVSEDTDLRDKEKNYNTTIFENKMSFKEAYDKMFGVSAEELEDRREKVIKEMREK
ncbi:MAG: hypothetical protein ABH844_02915 [Candidatus Omnitrophota bacterium]